MDGPCREKTLIEEIRELPPTVPDSTKERMVQKLERHYVSNESRDGDVYELQREYKKKYRIACSMFWDCYEHLMLAFRIMQDIRKLEEDQDEAKEDRRHRTARAEPVYRRMRTSKADALRYATVLLGRNQRMKVAAIRCKTGQITLQESDKVFLTVPLRCVILEEAGDHGQE